MTTTIHDNLTAIFADIAIHSPTQFSFDGREVAVRQEKQVIPVGSGHHPLPDDALVRTLQGALYDGCYARPFGVPRPATAADAEFAPRLSRQNRGEIRWDPGWQIYQLGDNGLVHVQKGERSRTAMPGEFAMAGTPGMAPRVGSTVSLLAQKESYQLQPGFYHVFGETLSDHLDDFNLVRFYFHATPASVEPLIAHLTTDLNRYQVPFQFKCLTDPASYSRTDAAVLYIAKRYYPIVARIVAGFPSSVLDALRSQTPLFSKFFRSGIGIAEDPANGESFGMHRCRLTAEGIADAWTNGEQGVEARRDAVRARFAMNGLDLDHPYLGYGSVDIFDIIVEDEEVTA